MDYPPLVKYSTTAEYRSHFERIYCRGGPIKTFDGILVRFRKSDFDHALFRSTKRDKNKDQFAEERGERIDWIEVALQDPDADLRQSYNRNIKDYDPERRLSLVQGNYAVVIRMTGHEKAEFLTAFVVDENPSRGKLLSPLQMMRMSPKWQ